MKIITKIYIFSFSLVVVFVIHFSFSAYHQKQIIREIEQIIEMDINISKNLTRLTIYQLEYSIHLERSISAVLEQHSSTRDSTTRTPSTQQYNDFLNNFKNTYLEVKSSIQTAIRQVGNKRFSKDLQLLNNKLDKIENLHKQYIDLSSTLFRYLENDDLEELILLQASFTPLVDSLNNTIEFTLFDLQEHSARSVKNIKLHEINSFYLKLLTSCLLLLLICIFLFIIINKIRKSIQHAVAFAENIEAGNRQLPAEPASKDEIGQITHAMEFMLHSITKAEDDLKRLALTDSLTGIANRLKFNTALDEEINTTRRYNHPLSLIMFDIDHFKKFNDTYGHDEGDRILIELTALISSKVRSTDLFARWGGEEFMLLSTNTECEDALWLADKLRKEVEDHTFSDTQKVTCSFGVAQFQNESADTFLKRVDIALYHSKESGRNRVTAAEHPIP